MKGTWLKRLMGLAEQVPKDFKDPYENAKPEKGEMVLGELPPNLIALKRTIRWLATEYLKEVEAHEKICRRDDSCRKFHNRVVVNAQELKTLQSVLMTSALYELDIINSFDYRQFTPAIRGNNLILLPRGDNTPFYKVMVLN